MVKRELVKLVMDVRSIIPRNSSQDLVLSGKVMTVFFVYGPRSGRSEEDKDSFYDYLSAEMQSKDENCILLENFSGHIGSSIEGVHGRQGWGIQQKDRERLMEFADSFDMVIGNTFF